MRALTTGICAGRVVVVTGAGNGLGREHARELARQGARVVVNDLGVDRAGHGRSDAVARQVVDDIVAAGGEAVAHAGDVSDWADAETMIQLAIDTFGALDAVVCNAGFVRDRMFANTGADEWDAILRVHLRGHFAPARHASAYWRDCAKAGAPRDARIVNTSSGAGLMGSVGQAAYSAAKGGIAALTLVQAAELARYGVTANAIAPSARTRMTEEVFGERMRKPDSGFDVNDPANVSPLVAWLVSVESRDVTGRVFEIEGGQVSVADGWQHGPAHDKGGRWEPDELGAVVRALIDRAPPPAPVYGAEPRPS
jgi:NAD(P)-dependent dehydrogenase (short-subunit alcohol dehydrogenase family)